MEQDKKTQETFVSPEAWVEWCEKCTIELCQDEHKHQLGAFGKLRLYKYLSRLSQQLAQEYCYNESAPLRAWLMMESFLYSERSSRAQTDRAGKRYKDYLLKATSGPSHMEAYLSTIFSREIPRMIARAEGSGFRGWQGLARADAPTVYLDQVSAEGGGSLVDNLIKLSDGRYVIGNTAQADPEDLDDFDVAQTRSETGTKGLYDDLGAFAARSVEFANETDDMAEDEPDGNAEGFPDGEFGKLGDSIHWEPLDNDAQEDLDDETMQQAQSLWDSWNDRIRLIFAFSLASLTVADIVRDNLIKDCAKTQIYAAHVKMRDSIIKIDWGTGLLPRQREWFLRQLMISLAAISTKWLSESEKYKEAHYYINRHVE